LITLLILQINRLLNAHGYRFRISQPLTTSLWNVFIGATPDYPVLPTLHYYALNRFFQRRLLTLLFLTLLMFLLKFRLLLMQLLWTPPLPFLPMFLALNLLSQFRRHEMLTLLHQSRLPDPDESHAHGIGML
jgi:hypothetical protein